MLCSVNLRKLILNTPLLVCLKITLQENNISRRENDIKMFKQNNPQISKFDYMLNHQSPQKCKVT